MMESINILQLQETESELMAYVNNKIKNDQQKKEEEENNLNKLLQQKEKDLVLAAELGKALLEKNEDLSQQNEKMAEDFAKQLEVSKLEFFRDFEKLALKNAHKIFLFMFHKKVGGLASKRNFSGFSWFLLIKFSSDALKDINQPKIFHKKSKNISIYFLDLNINKNSKIIFGTF